MDRVKSKRAFSLAEAVIALSVIVIVSISALSIALSSITARVGVIAKSDAQGFADDLWECFKVSDGQAEFEENVFFARGVLISSEETDADGYAVYNYNPQHGSFNSLIKIKYSQNQNERSLFSIEVRDKDGDEIVSFFFEKGDGI